MKQVSLKAGMNLGQIVNAIPGCKAKGGIPLNSCSPVHLDPDLEYYSLPRRQNGWRPSFGQANGPEGHLKSQCVKKGDLFLFFGLFRCVNVANIASVSGQIHYLTAPRPMHVLFGWLLVEKVIDLHSTPGHSPPWLAYHPHVKHRSLYSKKNAVYIAQKTLGSLDPCLARIPGGGAFDKFKPDLVLSDPKHQNLSVWKLPGWFMLHIYDRTKRLTYHPPVIGKSGRNRWTNLGNGYCQLQSVGRGQEFVLDCKYYSPQAVSWAVTILSLAEGNFR